MNFNFLPPEIIQIIFGYLPGSQTLKCRDVCVRWKDLVDDMSEDYWKLSCKIDFCDTFKDAYRKSNLTWFQLYESLCLWANVRSANVHIKASNIQADNFQLLANGILSIPHRTHNCLPGYNTIVYYDIETLKECHQENIEFFFKRYLENDNLLMLLNFDNQICLKIKSNKTSFYVGTLDIQAIMFNVNLVMLDTELYFIDIDSTLTVSSMIEKNHTKVIETKQYGFFNKEIEAVVRVNEDEVNILSIEGHIFSLKNGKIVELFFLDAVRDNNIRLLERSGFKWTSPVVLHHLLEYFDEEVEIPKALRDFKSPVICSFGDLVIIGTSRHYIHIFKIWLHLTQHNNYAMFDSDDEYDYYANFDSDSVSLSSFFSDSKKYSARKCKTICLKNMIPTESSKTHKKKKIEQIDILETLNGHKLIVLYFNQIIIIELNHSKIKTATKRATTLKDRPLRIKKQKNLFTL